MRNQKRTLIILLAVLAALILLITVGIPLLTAGGKEPKELDEKLYLCSFSKAELERIAYTGENGSAVLVRADGVWQLEDGTPVDATAAENMVSAVCGLYSTQIAFTGAEHFADCGLDAPTLTVSAVAGDASVTIRVGAYNNGLDKWYCTVNGGDTVYLIGNNLTRRFSAAVN